MSGGVGFSRAAWYGRVWLVVRVGEEVGVSTLRAAAQDHRRDGGSLAGSEGRIVLGGDIHVYDNVGYRSICMCM